MECYDVIVAGAGSIGIPAALALANRGLKTLVLERAASPGQGSNKSAIGGVRATHSDPAKIRLCQRSLEVFSTWQEQYGDDIEWHSGGYCFVAYRRREEVTLQSLLEVQKGYGLDIAWYGREELLEWVPHLNRRGLIGGTYAPQDGSCSPLLAAQAMVRAARRAGAEFHFGEEITAVQVRGGCICGVQTNRGNYAAPLLVNATGAWANALGELLGLQHPIHPDSHEAGISEPVQRFLEPMVVDLRPTGDSANFYFCQLKNGAVIFCITPQPNLWGTDRRETSRFLPQVSARMVELMPILANLRVRRTWRGMYPMTPDGHPIIGWSHEVQGDRRRSEQATHPERESRDAKLVPFRGDPFLERGYLLAIGMCGQGFMLGPGVGELLARMIMDSTTALDDEILGHVSPYRDFSQQEKLE